MSLQLRIAQETPCFAFSYDPVEKHRIIVSTTGEVTTNLNAIITFVLRQDSWHYVQGNTRHVQVISQNFVARTMTDPNCCCEVVYRLGELGMHQHCNLFNLAFTSNRLWPTSRLIILQTVSPLRKTSVPLKHKTATQCVVTGNSQHHLKRFGSSFSSFLTELYICP